MSKHIYEQLQPDGSMLEVQVGWDAPLQCFYFVVQRLQPPRFEETNDLPMLSNLFLDNPRKITLDDIRDLMESHNLMLPSQLYENVQRDRDRNVVNQIQYY